MIRNKFGTVVNCMDGRVQLPVIDFLKNNYFLDFIDVITEAGPNGILAKNDDISKINSIYERITVSIEKHSSKLIAIVGHDDCAGNPGNKEKQIKDIKEAMEKLREKFSEQVIIGLWVDNSWQVFEVV